MGKSNTIAERLMKPAMLVGTKKLLVKEAANALQKSLCLGILMSNDTVRRSQDKMAENLVEQQVEKLKVSKFSLQANETTVNTSAILTTSACLCLIHYWDDNS